MELVTVLKNFKASIDSKVENSRQDNGSRTDNYSQVVNSNLPASFNLIVPIFKGRPAEEIEVEIIADVDGRNIRLSLCSPGAEVIVEEERNKAIGSVNWHRILPLSNNNNEDCKEILEAGTCRIGFLHWQPRIQSHKCVVGNFNNYADSSIYSL